MKSIVFICLACLPLTVLTVASFVELLSGRGQLPPQTAAVRLAAQNLAEHAAAAAEAAKPLAAALARTDLFAPASLAAPAGGDVLLQEVHAAWPQWMAARQLAIQGLDALHAPSDDHQQIRLAIARLETLKLNYATPLPPGGAAMLKLVKRQIAGLKQQLALAATSTEARDLLQAARDALRPGMYGQCVAMCDRLLREYPSAFERDTLAKIGVLQLRARFNDDAEKLVKATTPQEQHDLLSLMVERYAHQEDLSAAQQEFLRQRRVERDRGQGPGARGQ